MQRSKFLKGALVALLASVMTIAVSACGGNSNDNNAASNSSGGAASASGTGGGASPAGSSAAAPSQKEPITMKVLLSNTDKDFEQTDVYNEIAKQTGVKMDIEKYDEKKFQVELAGGDLPDVIQVDAQYLQQLIEGKNIIPLDDLVQSNGPDILKPVYEKSLAYSRKFWSNDTGKLYLIPAQIGATDFGFDQQVGYNVRWDYYKELGYPPIENMDDMVNVLAQMVHNHPTTANGDKTYGVSLFNDWGTWGYVSMGLVTGHLDGGYNMLDGKYYNPYTDVDHSAWWDTAYFLYKSKQAGILDPDAFIDKYDDIVSKASKGTLLSSQATWPLVNANADLLKEGPDEGYVTIPLDWGYTYAQGKTVAGVNGRMYAISKNAKDPARAMDLINFLVSEQGSRLIASGVQGVDWDMVDGKPQLKPEVIALRSTGGDAWKKTGINMAANQQGLTDYTPTSDGSIVNLFDTSEVFAQQANSLNKDYDAHYGVDYPAAAYKKYVDEGKVKTLSDRPSDLMAAMPQPDEDTKKIQSSLDDMIMKGIPDIVLNAKDDADYQARQQALIKKLNNAGADKWFEWRLKTYQDTLAANPELAE